MTLAEEKLCSGCSACADVCPKGAIKMTPDREGFPRPAVDNSLCIECGACTRVCPVINPPKSDPLGRAYAYINPDREVVEYSSSGGVFTALASKILAEGGAVVGAAFTEKLGLLHTVIESVDGLSRLRGSKYLESDTEGIYRKMKALLSDGRRVLFSGTPCQTAAVRSYFGEREGLYLVELACHGVPSPFVFEKYLDYLRKKHGSSVVGFNFRHKKNGWQGYGTLAVLEDGRELFSAKQDSPYMRAFLGEATLRPSCHACSFKGNNRYADIMIADFWGVESLLPDLDNKNGVSLVIVHSEVGRELFSKVTDGAFVKEVDTAASLNYNSAVLHSVKPHKKRDLFMKRIVEDGFSDGIERMLAPSLVARVKSKIKRIIKRLLKR